MRTTSLGLRRACRARCCASTLTQHDAGRLCRLPALAPPPPPPRDALAQANYGRKDPSAVAAVKAVYSQLGLPAKFEAYEAQSHAQLSATIEEQSLLPKAVFTSLLAKIYKRQK